jgi:hypothetical protein
MLKEEQIRCLDACIICVDRYQSTGDFMQTIQLEGVIQLLLHLREETAKGTPYENRFSTLAELKAYDKPTAEAVADQIIKDLYNEHH